MNLRNGSNAITTKIYVAKRTFTVLRHSHPAKRNPQQSAVLGLSLYIITTSNPCLIIISNFYTQLITQQSQFSFSFSQIESAHFLSCFIFSVRRSLISGLTFRRLTGSSVMMGVTNRCSHTSHITEIIITSFFRHKL
ncbi:hypothetical protein L2E82_16872 [Cichorium intybus]|uniref:Uncharacterized protein n=1 Tax=Cichorium intybus TaxID=13427 RepID=A0ACB9F6C7_CICIN|nr:hypothetical protein L2E82_16872 [Cichorium intybus]